MTDEQTTQTEVEDNEQAVVEVERSKKRKRKKTYTRGLHEMQEMADGTLRASDRVANAVARGMKEFRKSSNKSARKKRDGALRDFGVNATRATVKTVRLASKAPLDVVETLETKRIRRLVKRQIKMAGDMSRELGLD